jgi:hypothetical protein
MDIVRPSGAAVLVAAVATLLAASASQPASAAPRIASNAFAARFAPTANQRRARVFISDAADETIDILDYATGGQVNQITGLNEPEGLCNDGETALLSNTGDSDLVRYSAGGKLLATLPDTGEYPVDCSVDRAGDVAAANIESTSGGPGSVSVWEHGTGSPTNYSVPGMTYVGFTAYDPHGDLFVSGGNGGSAVLFAELVKGASSFRPFTIEGATFGFSGGLQYAYGALAVGNDNGIYQVKVEGTRGRVVGSTRISGADGVFCITPFKTVIAINVGSSSVALYAYPTGLLIRTLGGGGFGQPISCTAVD